MAVRRDSDVLDSTYLLAQILNQGAEFFRCGKADRVGDVHRGRAGIHHRLHHLAQEIRIGTGGIFRGEFHVIAQGLSKADCFRGLLKTLLTADPELVMQMDIGGGEKHVNAGTSGMPKRLPRALNVFVLGPSQAGNYWPPH